MANGNPQKEEGFTPIANETVEHLMRVDFSPHETRLLLAIMRKTYGWKKRADKISLTQFEKACQLPRRCIARTLKKLEQRRLIIITREGARQTNWYRFNKKFKEWDSDSGVTMKGVDEVGDNSNEDSDSFDTTSSDSGVTTGIVTAVSHTKETLKKNITKESERNLNLYPHVIGIQLEEAKKNLIKKITF